MERFRNLFDGPAPTTLAEVARRYAAWWRSALERWASDNASDEDVLLLNWLLDAGLIPNRVETAAPSLLRERISAYRVLEKTLEAAPRTVNGLRDLDAGHDYRLNLRGEYDKLGPAVPRGYLEVLGDSPSAASIHDPRSGRMVLAERVASPSNPLTARVYVNRVWHWVFGAGLVATPDDFGRLGEKPSHPELLDWLADQFVKEGWSTKRLVRTLVTTAAFRQSDTTAPKALEIDPKNRLLHHYALRRLEAEAVRDAILSASGRLDPRLYGPPIDPPRSSEDPQKRLFSGPLDGEGRRSLYTKMTIMEPPRFLATFNQPPPKIPTGRRDVTDVPAQALALLNDPFVVAQAQCWGERLTSHEAAGTIDERITSMWASALGRAPSPEEIARWRSLVDDLARDRGVEAAGILSSLRPMGRRRPCLV